MREQRHIELTLQGLGVTARAVLHDLQAPRTCALMWEALPLEETVYHCIRCGSELFSLITPLAEVPPPENRCMMPSTGDLWFLHFPVDYQYNPPDFEGDARGVFDFIIWYGPDSWALDPGGNMLAGVHWATIVEGLDRFADASRELWLRGTDRLLVTRVG